MECPPQARLGGKHPANRRPASAPDVAGGASLAFTAPALGEHKRPGRPCLEVSKTPAPAAGRAVSRNGQCAGVASIPRGPAIKDGPRAPETARRRQSRTAPPGHVPAGAAWPSRPEFRPLARMETGEITGPRRAGYANNPSARTTARKRNKPVSTSFIAGPRASPISKSRRRPRPRPITRPPAGYPRQPIRPARPNGRPCADDWPRPPPQAPHTRPNGRPCEH